MGEQLRGAMAELITMLTKGAEGLYAFGQEQVPEVLSQLILWKTAQYGLLTVVLMATVLSYLWFIRRMCGEKPPQQSRDGDNRHPWIPDFWRDSDRDIHFHWVTLGVLGGLGATVCLLASVANLLNILKITLAPKVWLLEYAAQLVK